MIHLLEPLNSITLWHLPIWRNTLSHPTLPVMFIADKNPSLRILFIPTPLLLIMVVKLHNSLLAYNPMWLMFSPWRQKQNLLIRWRMSSAPMLPQPNHSVIVPSLKLVIKWRLYYNICLLKTDSPNLTTSIRTLLNVCIKMSNALPIITLIVQAVLHPFGYLLFSILPTFSTICLPPFLNWKPL